MIEMAGFWSTLYLNPKSDKYQISPCHVKQMSNKN